MAMRAHGDEGWGAAVTPDLGGAKSSSTNLVDDGVGNFIMLML
jgi:hypothetical protein